MRMTMAMPHEPRKDAGCHLHFSGGLFLNLADGHKIKEP
jgi:hypothetical protein